MVNLKTRRNKKNFGEITTSPGFGQSAAEERDCWKYITIKGSVTFSKAAPRPDPPKGRDYAAPQQNPPNNPSGGKVTFKYVVKTGCRCIAPFLHDAVYGLMGNRVNWDRGGTVDVGGCEPDGSRNFKFWRQSLEMKGCKNKTVSGKKVKCDEITKTKSEEKEYTFEEFLNHTTFVSETQSTDETATDIEKSLAEVETDIDDFGGEQDPLLMWSGNSNAGQNLCGLGLPGSKYDKVDSAGTDPNGCKAWFKTLQDTTVECGATNEEAGPWPDDLYPPDSTNWPERLTYIMDDETTPSNEMADFQKCLLDKMLCPDSDTGVVAAFLNAFLSPNIGGEKGGEPNPMDEGPLDDPDVHCISATQNI